MLFTLAQLGSAYPTPDSLHNGRIGLVPSLLRTVLTHRLGMRRFPPIGYPPYVWHDSIENRPNLGRTYRRVW
jgi:hypothetical protein